jgi:L-threonylcarbamoyladenylate synthase
LPRADHVSDVVTGGQDTVAVRVPSHPVAQQLLQAFGGGIAAPSANRYGRLSPTRPEHVRDELGDAVRIILDGGDCQIGLESTIVAVEGDAVRLLRPGAVTASQLRAVAPELLTAADAHSPRVPGSVPSHYAPNTPLDLIATDDIDARAEALAAGGERVAVLARHPPRLAHPRIVWVNAGEDPRVFAHALYASLRALDACGCQQILVQAVPDDESWDAIRDRLRRAAMRVAAAETATADFAGGRSISLYPDGG